MGSNRPMKNLVFILILFFLDPLMAQEKPPEPGERIGLNLGLQKEVITQRIDANPVNFSNDDIVPPIITVKGVYQPNYKGIFQPDAQLAASLLSGGGQYLYVQAGGWFDFEKFHLFFGAEYFTTLSAGEFGVSPVDHSGAGGYVAGAMPLGIFYPKLEIRYREISETEVANREGLSTYVGHDGDRFYRPSLNVDLSVVELWGALTYYQIGNTALASDGFSLGIEGNDLTIYSLGVGFNLNKVKIWVKGHQINGIDDEVAHYYQAPQIYPDFLLATQTFSVEALWQF
ncbi:MAG: hypothetical protein MJK18_08525, partial [Bdellovibrionales bacterium]|nr:hypothetical protein [Bdellovibrionales bacterium]